MAEEKKGGVLETLVGKFGDDTLSTHSDFGDDTALVRRERIVEICTFLRDDPGLRFDFAMDLTGVDYLGGGPRFEGVSGHPLRKDYPKANRQPTIGPDE